MILTQLIISQIHYLSCTGVSMWNSVIALEGQRLEKDTFESLARVRHIAVDCMYMSTTVLGGISARYNIDDLSLMKFYTACGQKYATDIDDIENAELCFSKAMEFAESATREAPATKSEKITLSRAMFDLLLGRAECSWERGDSEQAETYVNDARKYLDDLPGEFEFLASIEYNFGLFTYQEKCNERALKWLQRSIETRGNPKNQSKNLEKQSRTTRLAAVCLLALQKYEESWEMMGKAEEMHHDAIGSYLLLKLSIITKKKDASNLMLKIIEDHDSSLDVCVATIALFGDAQRLSEAAIGYESLFNRFRDNPKVQACVIGPRYFETLAALGKIDKALQILEQCFSFIVHLYDESTNQHYNQSRTENFEIVEDQIMQLVRWAALLLSIGSAQADRKDFRSSALLLTRSLDLARKAKQIGGRRESSSDKPCNVEENVVLENEARVCRLASSCALCSINPPRKSLELLEKGGELNPSEADDLTEEQKSILDLSIRHASRAKELEPEDFAPRLLLFRSYLVGRKLSKAAEELEAASEEIKFFDPGALAEAACAAREIGSIHAVISVLRCIVTMDTKLLIKSLDSTTPSPPPGFYGAVLLSCVNLQLKGPDETKSNPMDAEQGSTQESEQHGSENLFHTLRSGVDGIKKLSLDVAFDKSSNVEERITYLMNVSWNAGRDSGEKMIYGLWESFFGVCYEYSTFLADSPDILQTRRMSKLMSACANIENPQANVDSLSKARVQLVESRKDSQKLQAIAPSEGEDPMEGILLLLEARCCVGCKDLVSLEKVVKISIGKSVSAGILEQLAAICYNFVNQKEDGDSETCARTVDMTAALLSQASDLRLCDEKKDIAGLAVTLREHLGIELSRGGSAARPFSVFRKSAGVVAEYGDSFPEDERRWLVAVGWDRAHMYKQIGQNAEAKRWCELVLKLTEECVALSSYRPRLDAFMKAVSQTK